MSACLTTCCNQCCACCTAIDNLLGICASNKNIVLGVGLLFLVSLSLMVFAILTKDICYFGLKIKGPGMIILLVSLLLLILCCVLLLNFIMSENSSWILMLTFVITLLWLANIIGLIVAFVHYKQSEAAQKEQQTHSPSIARAAIFIVLELTWFKFILVMYKFYRTTRPIKEQPGIFEEK